MKVLKNFCIGLSSLLLTLTVFAGSHNNGKTIAEIAAGNPDFSTLVSALKAADLVETLNGKGPFTVFAPTNEAFAKLPAGTLQKLLDNPEQLKKILLYHVVAGDIKSSDVKPGDVKTVEGSDITISMKDGKVMVNDAEVTTADIDASNGVIHVINNVLIPAKQ